MYMKTIGFLVNPVAGMGGAVGLKGTDGLHDEAARRGAVPVAPSRAAAFLAGIGGRRIRILTCSGIMGADVATDAGIPDIEVVYEAGRETGAQDTINACRAMRDAGVALIVFCGGDGTARDVLAAVGRSVPVLGIPAGVKMYSAVFATTPKRAAEVVSEERELPLVDAEVMDVDEDAYRRGELSTTIFGYARVPSLRTHIQAGKWVSSTVDEEAARQGIARFVREIMRDDTLYILGAGTTTAAIASALGEEGTLLGIDAVVKGSVLARDLNENGLLSLLDEYTRAKIIISPIGAQGFVLGRGNQQISPRVLEKVGVENLIVVATPAKLLQTPTLYVDSGNELLNSGFEDSILVICGYRMGARMPLVHS
jgi:predicted polyphosphate/ATP-dependent NAD kinase